MDESMADQMILLDSSILIDFFRKTKKEKTAFFKLSEQVESFSVSVISQFEVLVGSTAEFGPFWNEFFEDMTILSLTEECIEVALQIDLELKLRNKRIDFPDLMIAATAVANDLPLATLNLRHFGRINELNIYKGIS